MVTVITGMGKYRFIVEVAIISNLSVGSCTSSSMMVMWNSNKLSWFASE